MNHYKYVDGELIVTSTNQCPEDQVLRVACKSEVVFDKILDSFCVSQDPSTIIEDEWYAAHSSYDESLPTDDVIGQDAEGIDILSRNTNGVALDKRTQLETDNGWLPTLRGESGGVRPTFDVEVFKTQWLVDNYAGLRKCAYGNWEQQMEMQYDGTWNSHVAAVKTRFPKV